MSDKITRRQARENAFLAAFSMTFHDGQQPEEPVLCAEGEEISLDSFAKSLLALLQQHTPEADEIITAHLKDWTLARIPRVSLVALRLAVCEMKYGAEKKPAVAINEAVELVKKYGAEDDYQFVNGLLGAVAKELAPETSEADAGKEAAASAEKAE